MLDYRKLIPSSNLRCKILNWLRFVPDSMMIPLQYWIQLGRWPDLEHPRRYTEKLQWYKQHYRNPVMHRCVDKYLAREYVASKGLSDILVPFVGVYSSFDEIDWDQLPKQFVMKRTNGGGGRNVVLCPDKRSFDIDDAREKLQSSTQIIKPNTGGREWAYYGLDSKIIVEKMLVNEEQPEVRIMDYKILCFHGTAKYIVLDMEREIRHRRIIYDRGWNDLHIEANDAPYAVDKRIPVPSNLSSMIVIAETLSKDFPHVRVDLYNVNHRIYFGELTFYPWSGYVAFTPDEFDYILGENFSVDACSDENIGIMKDKASMSETLSTSRGNRKQGKDK